MIESTLLKKIKTEPGLKKVKIEKKEVENKKEVFSFSNELSDSYTSYFLFRQTGYLILLMNKFSTSQINFDLDETSILVKVAVPHPVVRGVGSYLLEDVSEREFTRRIELPFSIDINQSTREEGENAISLKLPLLVQKKKSYFTLIL